MCVFWKMISVECGCHVRVKYSADDECAKCTFDSMPPALLSDSFINAFVTEHVPLVHYLQLEISVHYHVAACLFAVLRLCSML